MIPVTPMSYKPKDMTLIRNTIPLIDYKIPIKSIDTEIGKMEMNILSYKVMGIGSWVSATVSKAVAIQLAAEYEAYGWPVKVGSIETENQHHQKVA